MGGGGLHAHSRKIAGMNKTPPASATYQIDLNIEGRSCTAEVVVPNREITLAELLPLLWRFQDSLIQVWTVAETEAGKSISCRKGCGACCRQLVPVSEIEALHLARVLADLPDEARARVTVRFEEAVAQLERAGLLACLTQLSGRSREEKRRVGLAYFNERIACPFLEDESCSIHPERPSACREYLVTSPAANCAHPTPETVETIRHSAKFSQILFTFCGGTGSAPLSAIPLILILQRQDRPGLSKREYAPRLFEEFLRRLRILWDKPGQPVAG
jgi:Fe-S-cluster containining protein